MSQFCLIITKCDSESEARGIAQHAVELKLAGSAHCHGPVNSVYRWEEKIRTATEWECVIKTRKDLFPQVEAMIADRHSYATPCIIAVPIQEGSEAYLNWLSDQLPA
jgi:periplasmic divalent cation tolerance protein